MRVGVPNETSERERRVAIVPETVKKLAAKEVEVALEAGAGDGAHFPDAAYEEAGAKVGGSVWDADVDVQKRRRGFPLARGDRPYRGGFRACREHSGRRERRRESSDRVVERPPGWRDQDQLGAQAGDEAHGGGQERRSRSSAAKIRKTAKTRRSVEPLISCAIVPPR